MHPDELSDVTESTVVLKARCVGRYLIDMPARARSSGYAQLQGIEFLAEPMSRDAYSRGLDARAATLNSIAGQIVHADGDAGSEGTRYFISRAKPHDPRDTTRVIDACTWRDGHRIALKVRARDDTNGMADPSSDGDIREKTQRVFSLLRSVRARVDDEIPTTPGVCFPGGFLPGESVGPERIETRFTLDDHPDVSFTLTTDSGARKADTLLQRGADIESRLKGTSGGRTLRRASVDLRNGLRAQEWLTTGLMPLKAKGHIFELECDPSSAGSEAPFLTLDMHNGGIPADIDWNDPPKRASLTEDEALALWDAVSRTLRPRHNGSCGSA